jgi:hypothetical protein
MRRMNQPTIRVVCGMCGRKAIVDKEIFESQWERGAVQFCQVKLATGVKCTGFFVRLTEDLK